MKALLIYIYIYITKSKQPILSYRLIGCFVEKCLFMEHLICSLNSWKYNINDFSPHFEEKTNCSSELRLIYSFIHSHFKFHAAL